MGLFWEQLGNRNTAIFEASVVLYSIAVFSGFPDGLMWGPSGRSMCSRPPALVCVWVSRSIGAPRFAGSEFDRIGVTLGSVPVGRGLARGKTLFAILLDALINVSGG